MVDLEGAKADHVVNYKVLEKVTTKTNLKIDFGGGLKSDDDVFTAFNSGARQITGGSIAVKNTDTFLRWINKYGTQKIILGADCKNEKIAISGWLEESSLEVVPFIQEYQKNGIQYVVCTDISKDGMLQGPSVDLYKKIINQCTNGSSDQSVKLIASGGVTTIEDVEVLSEIGCDGVIIGKAIYENRISLKELERFL